ncbi:hypothetical protein C5C36_15815 [Rathayibacter sp. AY1G1]|uniref:DUF4232 domain-containing protein n=1 Tax=Rathayibacter sp. AY1G1 TaxID=2080564 RepID=UPI000CE9128B|nr:DUF4232 domain-containing protein [Rathayibacter sp. AY1G1]PPF71960.1 hypothetical protein C5C46_08475 [Rathayibacter sp. AY1E6]PPG41377.1 hypothetical protein C5C30_08290 [Rathayibacter sp. AY2B5]PPH34545.1 hypothetical protein C5C53_15455 [Rathayibacter sp. AY1E3]PPI00061.1 hypothetical protein C5C95_05655 [Rathayibacter sp. AY1B7]PPH08879.1 hypothetical protein C5C36_15815 [Rathayibacter sp. AY1G1]
MTTTRTSHSTLALLLAVPVFALVGCAGSTAGAPASTSAAAPASTATAAPTSAPATPAATATAGAAAAGPVWPADPCRDTQLTVTVEDRPELSGAGQEEFAIVLTNASDQACSYFGWPGVLMLGADGTQLTTAGTSGAEAFPGALAPGESAQAEGQLSAVGAYDCTPTTATTVRVLVTSDGAGPGIDTPSDFQVCGGDGRSDFTTGPLTPAS